VLLVFGGVCKILDQLKIQIRTTHSLKTENHKPRKGKGVWRLAFETQVTSHKSQDTRHPGVDVDARRGALAAVSRIIRA
jgi:hypothetical protein